MAISTLEGVESVRVIRAAGNLKITGTDRAAVEIDSNTAPRVDTNAGIAEVTLRDNATIAVAKGVTVEIEDVAGNLDVAELATPFVVKRVRGNLHARRMGAISMLDTVSGNVTIKEAGAVDGLKVRGALTVESAGAITFGHVAGGLDCRTIDGEVAIEKIAGGVHLLGLRAPFIARVIGGHLEVEDGAQVEAGVVGGKYGPRTSRVDSKSGKSAASSRPTASPVKSQSASSAAMHVLAASAAHSISKRSVARSIWPVPFRPTRPGTSPAADGSTSKSTRARLSSSTPPPDGAESALTESTPPRSSGSTTIMFMARLVPIRPRARGPKSRSRRAAPT